MKTIDLAPSPVLEIPPLILRTAVESKKKTADMVFFPGMWSTANHSPCNHWSDLVGTLEVINWPGHNGNDTHLLEGLTFMDCYHHAVKELAKFISPPHVMAHSFGALILGRVRYYQPQLMKSLVTINGAPPGQIGVPSKFRFVPYLYYLHGTKRPFELFPWDRTFVAGKSRGIRFGPESALIAKEVLQGDHHIPYRPDACPMLHVFGDSDQFYGPNLQHKVARLLGARPWIVENGDHMFHCNPHFRTHMHRILEWSFSHN